MIDEQLAELKKRVAELDPTADVEMSVLPGGSTLIKVLGIPIEGWNRPTADILFVAPVGYPGAVPDCFWVEPNGLRVGEHGTPQASNDSNPIPSDIVPNRSTTWFSWHMQGWNPSKDTLYSFFLIILDRLRPAR